jgi:hypothetical protein
MMFVTGAMMFIAKEYCCPLAIFLAPAIACCIKYFELCGFRLM